DRFPTRRSSDLLVVPEALNHHQGMLFALAVEAADLAEHGRDMSEALFSQEAAHFQLRMHSRGNAPQHLDHHRVADDRRTVGLLGRGITYFDAFRELDFSQLREWLK